MESGPARPRGRYVAQTIMPDRSVAPWRIRGPMTHGMPERMDSWLNFASTDGMRAIWHIHMATIMAKQCSAMKSRSREP